MKTLIPLLLACLFWVCSHVTPWVLRSEDNTASAWMLYSRSGQLGWSRCELSGPDPQAAFDTHPEQIVEVLARFNANKFFRLDSHWSSQQLGPDVQPDTIESSILQLSWALIALVMLVGACTDIFRRWRRSRSTAG